jgi:hypothetical protein
MGRGSAYVQSAMLQPAWRQSDTPQAPASLAAQGGWFERAVWAAGTLNFLASRALPQEGQEGFSLPRIKYSNSWPQDWQVYS